MAEGVDIIKSNKLNKRLDRLRKPEGNIRSKSIDRVLDELPDSILNPSGINIPITKGKFGSMITRGQRRVKNL